MAASTADITNWMHMFRWVVKLIRDEYGIDEAILTRSAVLETDIGLSIENVERVLEYISDAFQVRFPDGTLDEVLRLEELCLLAAWLNNLYKCPPFIGVEFAAACRALNPEMTA